MLEHIQADVGPLPGEIAGHEVNFICADECPRYTGSC
ncbi:hypothetical protein ACLK1S_13160 [Escherichia coli]